MGIGRLDHSTVSAGRDRLMPTPQELACSLAATNPAVQLVVLAVRGELASGTVQAAEAVATVRYAAPVFFESLSSKRCVLVVRRIRSPRASTWRFDALL